MVRCEKGSKGADVRDRNVFQNAPGPTDNGMSEEAGFVKGVSS
jgi:hypothetical protein